MTHASSPRLRPRRGRALPAAAAVLLGVAVLAACGSDAKQGKAGATATTKAAVTIPTIPAPTEVQLRGNVQMTGALTISVPKADGVCREHQHGLAREYVVRGGPLGQNGFIAVFGPTPIESGGSVPPNIKVYVNGIGLESAQTGTGVTVAADQQSVSFDTNLAGGTGNSRNGAPIPSGLMRGHITGRLRCG